MQRRIKQVFTSLREHTCVSYAKIATIGGLCDLDHIVVKATSPDDILLPDRYVLEILQIFSICPSAFGSFAVSFSRCFGKTRCWRVALKCLLLLRRLLRSLPGISPFREQFLLARSNSLVSLYPCNFKDCSSSASQDYTNFIQSCAHLLDKSLDCFATQEKKIQEDNNSENFIDKIDEVRLMLEFLPQLQNLIDRVLKYRPAGPAARSFLIQSAMKHIICDSFTCYTTFRKEIVEVLDYLIQLPYRSCAAAFEIYKKAAIQANELSEFYDWCKSLGFCRMYEYPFIDKIPQIQIRALQNFLSGMWQLTDDPSSSSTSVSPVTSTLQSPSTEDGRDKKKPETQSRFDSQYSLTVKGESEMLPLIEFEDDNDWETLLDASVSFQCTASSGNFFLQNNVYQSPKAWKDLQTNGWEIQVHNPYAWNQSRLSMVDMRHF